NSQPLMTAAIASSIPSDISVKPPLASTSAEIPISTLTRSHATYCIERTASGAAALIHTDKASAVSRPISAMTFDGEAIPRRSAIPPTRPFSQPLILSHSHPAMLAIPFQRPLTIFLPVSNSHLPASLTRFHILPGRSVNHLKMVLA